MCVWGLGGLGVWGFRVSFFGLRVQGLRSVRRWQVATGHAVNNIPKQDPLEQRNMLNQYAYILPSTYVYIYTYIYITTMHSVQTWGKA